jgi:hypothetical protein
MTLTRMRVNAWANAIGIRRDNECNNVDTGGKND